MNYSKQIHYLACKYLITTFFLLFLRRLAKSVSTQSPPATTVGVSTHLSSKCSRHLINYLFSAMGIMLVYDITNEKSFENIVKWLRNIDEHANEDVERMILGNKCDMTDKRIVSKERGEAVSLSQHLVISSTFNILSL